MTVHGFHIGQAHGVVHFLIGVQFRQHGLLHVVIRFGIDQRHKIGIAKIIPDFVLSDLDGIELGRLDFAVAVDIGALLGVVVAQQHQHHKHRRNHEPGQKGKFSHEGNFRHKILMLGLIHQGAKQHEKARHKHEYGQQGKQHRLNQADGHVRADFELHEHHGNQTTDGGQAAGADFRDALAQGGNDRLPDGQLLPFLLIPVAQNDRVVQRQRQLQNAGHGVGDKGNRSHEELAALIENHGGHKGQQQHGNLRVGLGGQ